MSGITGSITNDSGGGGATLEAQAAYTYSTIIHDTIVFANLVGGKPTAMNLNNTSYDLVYYSSGANVGKIYTITGGGFVQTFTYDAFGNVLSKITTSI